MISLYESYKRWCSRNFEEPIRKHVFNRLLQERGLQKARATSDPNRGRIHWFGICLQTPEPPGGGKDVG